MDRWLSLICFQVYVFLGVFVFSDLAHAAPSAGGADHATPWGTLVFPVINFSIFAYLVSLIVKKHVLPALEARKEHIEADLDESSKAAAEASARLTELRSRLENIDGEKQEILSSLDAQGRNMAKVIIANANEAAKHMAEETERHIKSEQTRAKTEVRRELILEASRIAREEIVKEMSPEVERKVRDKVLGVL